MPIPSYVNLGSLTRVIALGAKWRAEDDFPSNQAWADEVERVLSHLQVHGQFQKYLSRLRGNANQRDGALAEARTSFFFHRNGFSILTWEPEEVSNRPGDLEIQWAGISSIFVEVKGPGWEGELTKQELATRKGQPKYIHGEARSVDPVERVIYAADKALPKLSSNKANMLVVVDDLFVSPLDMPRDTMEDRIKYEIAKSKYARLGAILLLNPVCYIDEVDYRTRFIENPAANVACAIPANLF